MSTKEILVISSFPPRKCGIAAYSQDLIESISSKYAGDLRIRGCALMKKGDDEDYAEDVKYFLRTWKREDYTELAEVINRDKEIMVICIQHEFGLYGGELGIYLIDFMKHISVPIITTLHTVLPKPNEVYKSIVKRIEQLSTKIIVMTDLSVKILKSWYQIEEEKIIVIPHGTHLIKPQKRVNRQDVPFPEKTILSTFGLIGESKGIETALEAIPNIVSKFPNVLYLIIGKTHPDVIEQEGERYREYLTNKVAALKIEKYVLFINKYLPVKILMEYLQRTDIYLFTSNDAQQAVSGTLSYAISAGCPVISTPIPHALELMEGAGINFDFNDSEKLSEAVITLLSNPSLMERMWMNGLHNIRSTSWQNVGISHIKLVQDILMEDALNLVYKYPPVSLVHIKRMTTNFGILQFSKISEPDPLSGYTLDDNSRALIALTRNFEQNGDFEDLHLINIYLEFILFCQKEDNTFLNYVTIDQQFFSKNLDENLEDSNGRAIWALGEFLSLRHVISLHLRAEVETVMRESFGMIKKLRSPRAMAFSIKGLICYYHYRQDRATLNIIIGLAEDLALKYGDVSNKNWEWYESYMTYANAVIPEAMLLAGIIAKNPIYRLIAKKTFDFLLSITHANGQVSMISNVGRYENGNLNNIFGEQPIEFAYTILALEKFYEETGDESYLHKLKSTFNWFMGDNHLCQIIYNPSTGGCYDGLEEISVNLNQGAESTISYLLARLSIEKFI